MSKVCIMNIVTENCLNYSLLGMHNEYCSESCLYYSLVLGMYNEYSHRKLSLLLFCLGYV